METARPEVLDKLLATTERIVQEIDSVEYGILTSKVCFSHHYTTSEA
jgi:magnesium chelatase subunit H